MTPEQLDEIEKRWDGYLEKNEVERRFLFDQWWDKRDFWDMTKALREARSEADITKAFHDVAVKERDYERVRANRIEKERDEARAEVERLRSALRLLWNHASNAWIPRDCSNAVKAALKEDE